MAARPTRRSIESPYEAELLAEEWMRYFGYRDAAVTKRGADRGIDVSSATAVAQVKYWTTKKVGRPDLQMLKGAAEGKAPLFFSLSGYSTPAAEWADEKNIALFTIDYMGSVQAVNRDAEAIVRAASNLGPPLTDRQLRLANALAGLAALAVGLLVALVAWIWISNRYGNCSLGVDTTSSICDEPSVFEALAAVFFGFAAAFGAAAGIYLWLEPAVRSKWQRGVDARWRADR